MPIDLKEIASKEAGKILLAAIPIYASVATFMFETGYYDSFGVPLELIKLTSPMVIHFWVLVLTVTGICFSPLLLALIATPKGPKGGSWGLAIWLLGWLLGIALFFDLGDGILLVANSAVNGHLFVAFALCFSSLLESGGQRGHQKRGSLVLSTDALGGQLR
jgi:hypothetical protein